MRKKTWKIVASCALIGCALLWHTLGASLWGTDVGQQMALRQVMDAPVAQTGFATWNTLWGLAPSLFLGVAALLWWPEVAAFVRLGAQAAIPATKEDDR
jgi:hypothetical protein